MTKSQITLEYGFFKQEKLASRRLQHGTVLYQIFTRSQISSFTKMSLERALDHIRFSPQNHASLQSVQYELSCIKMRSCTANEDLHLQIPQTTCR